jgi:hypothetical protein
MPVVQVNPPGTCVEKRGPRGYHPAKAGLEGPVGAKRHWQEEAKMDTKAAPANHKFSEDSQMSYEEVYRFAYQDRFIPLMKALANDVGRERFIEMLKKAGSETAVEEVRTTMQDLAVKNPSTFLRPLREPSRRVKHTLTWEIIEDTEEAAEIKVTECLWAKTFREADAADIGYAILCHGDYAAAPAFSPKMKMIRTKTLMQAHDCCNHRWVMER